MMALLPPQVPGLPMALAWVNEPVSHDVEQRGRLVVEAGPATDLFLDPGGSPAALGAPMLVGQVAGDLLLSATIGLDFDSDFDAGALVVYAGPTRWAKLAFEMSPQGQARIVSVVTDGVSDDCNSMVVTAPTARLRVARLDDAWAFHVLGEDGRWDLVRHFRMGGECAVGFLAQSPTGDGATVTFDDIRLEPRRLDDLRGGT